MRKKPSSRYYKNLSINCIYRVRGDEPNAIVEFYSYNPVNGGVEGWVELGKYKYLHKNLNYHDIVEITEKEAFIEIL